MTAHVSFSVPREAGSLALVAALSNAWLQLRYDHPTIASWVEYDQQSDGCKKIYKALNDENTLQRQAWLDQTFRIVSNGQNGKEWCNSDPPVPKLPTIFLIIRSNTTIDDKYKADVVLRSRHDIVDGIGCLQLLNNLFKHASLFLENPNSPLPKFGNEWKNLSPPLRVAASIPASLQPKQQEQLMQISKTNSSLRENIDIASLPFKRGPVVPQRHQRVELTLDLEQSSSILDSIKHTGASVTHVYHAAIALLLRDLQSRGSQERRVRYISYSLINERPLCKEPYSTPQHAASVYHSASIPSLVIDLTVPSSSEEQATSEAKKEEFTSVVEQVKSFYLTIRDDKEHISLVPTYWAQSTPSYPVGPGVPPVPAPNETPSISISSMGVIDSIISPKHGHFELQSPWVTGEELGSGLGFFLGSFRGRMCLSAAYNDAWHDGDEVLRLLRDCNELVAQGLGV